MQKTHIDVSVNFCRCEKLQNDLIFPFIKIIFLKL